MTVIRRGWALAAALIAAALVLTGCTGPGGSVSAAPTPTASDANSGFPVTLKHVYGETTITQKPQRVLTVGWATHDIVAGLGVIPVGIPETWGEDQSGYTAWFRDQVENELKGTLPPIVKASADGPDYEAILALKPDVILAPYSGIKEVEYKRLSEIAPTVAYTDRAWSMTSWSELTRTVASAIGRTDAGETAIAKTTAAINEAKQQYPNLAGSSFIYTTSGGDAFTELALYTTTDARVGFLHDLGLVDSPQLATLNAGIDKDAFYGGVSLEKLDTIQADLVVSWSWEEKETDITLNNPLFARWAPVKAGQYYFLNDHQLAAATSSPNILTIPWSLEQGYAKDVSAALNGGAVIREAK